MSKVKEAAIALVEKFKVTTAIHEEVAVLEQAIAADVEAPAAVTEPPVVPPVVTTTP
jgi:hypothetical protein